MNYHLFVWKNHFYPRQLQQGEVIDDHPSQLYAICQRARAKLN